MPLLNYRKMAQFYQRLRELASCPSESEAETPIRGIIERQLGNLDITIEEDDIGNMYVHRSGDRPGHIMLSAHQDKRMDSCFAGYVIPKSRTGTNVVFNSRASMIRTVSGIPFALIGGEYKPIKVSYDNAEVEFKELPTARGGRIAPTGMCFAEGLEAKLPRGTLSRYPMCPIYSLLGLHEREDKVLGKLDDALGISLIIDALRNTNPRHTQDITALFTVEEEIGHFGAEHAIEQGHIEEVNPDKIIVFDTTLKLPLGSGLALYE